MTPIRCPRCRARFGAPGWTALPLVERLEAREIGRLVLGWPSNDCVEVRTCRACGKLVAARTPLAEEDREASPGP